MINKPKNFHQLIVGISSNEFSFTRIERKIASFILSHPYFIANNTISNLAKKADVNLSAVIRFSKKFQFTGYTEFQNVFKETEISYYSDSESLDGIDKQSSIKNNDKHDYYNILHKLNSDATFKKANNIINQNKEFILVGVQKATPVIAFYEHALTVLKKDVWNLHAENTSRAIEKFKNLKRNPVIIIVSFKHYSKEVVDLAEIISQQINDQKKKFTIICITDSNLSPYKNISDVYFITGENTGEHKISILPALSIAEHTVWRKYLE